MVNCLTKRFLLKFAVERKIQKIAFNYGNNTLIWILEIL